MDKWGYVSCSSTCWLWHNYQKHVLTYLLSSNGTGRSLMESTTLWPGTWTSSRGLVRARLLGYRINLLWRQRLWEKRWRICWCLKGWKETTKIGWWKTEPWFGDSGCFVMLMSGNLKILSMLFLKVEYFSCNKHTHLTIFACQCKYLISPLHGSSSIQSGM